MIEYFVFCTEDRPLQIAELAATLNDAGWSVRVVRNWLAPNEFQVIDDGVLIDGDSTFGWPAENELAPRFDGAISVGDRKQLDDWVQNDQLGYAMWFINSPFDFGEHCGFESLDHAREQMGERYANHLAQTKSMYVVAYCPQMEFTAVAMGAAAMLRGGLIEDPQIGSCMFPPSNASELTRFLEQWPIE